MLKDLLHVDTGEGSPEPFVRVPSNVNALNQTKYKRKTRLANNRRSEIDFRSNFDGKGARAQGHYTMSKKIDTILADGSLAPIVVNLAVHWPEAALASSEVLIDLVKGALSQIVSILRSDPSVSDISTGAVNTAGVNTNRVESMLLGEI